MVFQQHLQVFHGLWMSRCLSPDKMHGRRQTGRRPATLPWLMLGQTWLVSPKPHYRLDLPPHPGCGLFTCPVLTLDFRHGISRVKPSFATRNSGWQVDPQYRFECSLIFTCPNQVPKASELGTLYGSNPKHDPSKKALVQDGWLILSVLGLMYSGPGIFANGRGGGMVDFSGVHVASWRYGLFVWSLGCVIPWHTSQVCTKHSLQYDRYWYV